MNHRLTAAAAIAVILASISEFSLISGASWLADAIGAVAVVALAGTLTRQSQVPAAIGATALAAVASAPLLTAAPVYLKVLGVAVIAACAASAWGLRPLRAVAGLVTYLAALLLYLNVVHAAARSFLRVVPTGASLRHLSALVGQGGSAARLQPPVTGHAGVLLLAAGSIGLVAIVVDFLAVRLHRPAIAGLPLLVVYMAPIATTAKVGGIDGAIAFLVAAAGYLALLSSDGRHRLRGWGRVVTVWHYSGEDERLGGADMGGLAATGRRIGLAAVCAAIIAPLLVPGLTLHQLFAGHSGDGGHHVPVGLPNPVAQMHGLLSRATPERVLTYHTTAQDGENYLQVYVLNYDVSAGEWDLVRPASGASVGTRDLLPAPGVAPAVPRTQVTTTVDIPKVAGYSWPIHFLPVPYWPIRVRVSGSWHESLGTLMIYSGDAIGSPLRYTVTSGEAEPSVAALTANQHLPPAIARSYLTFKSPVTRQLTKIADRVTKGKTTAFDKAVALERWFLSSRFSYSIQSSLPNTPEGLLTFLTSDRQGFCQQFAFAMAVLARTLGIPSRVAIGFTAGQQRQDGSWVVTTADAHAWPELYFSGVGWLRFEPTPGGVGGQDTAVEPSYVSGAPSAGGPTRNHPGPGVLPSTSPAPRSSGNIAGHVRPPGIGDGGLSTATAANHGTPPFGWIILGILAVAAIAPGTARLVSRRRRWAGASGDLALASAAWGELCADLEDYGLSCRASESPRAVARRVCSGSGLDDQARKAIGRVADVVERARYAPAPADASSVRADVTAVRRALARNVTRGARWRAALLPASTLRPARASLRQAAGLLAGWTPAAGES